MGECKSHLELAQVVVKLTKSKSKIVFQPLPIDDPKQRKPDISLAREKLNWEPSVSIEEGLKETILYFKNKYFEVNMILTVGGADAKTFLT